MSWRLGIRNAVLRVGFTLLPRADAVYAARQALKLRRSGFAVTVGHFPADKGLPDEIVTENQQVAALLAGSACDAYLAIKAPPLEFDAARLDAIAKAADLAGLPLVFDSHSHAAADQTMVCMTTLLFLRPGTGIALPARWQRSEADAALLRDTSARIRLVKGEWAEPDGSDDGTEARFLALASQLAGRRAPVGIATHDPALADAALRILLAAGTPCELEQLRGLPRRRSVAVARRLGVRVRVYLPFGPGWWPYALNKAMDRPWLLKWWLKDFFAQA